LGGRGENSRFNQEELAKGGGREERQTLGVSTKKSLAF